MAFELFKLKIPVRQATVGPVNKKDILMAKSIQDPLNKAILGFSTKPNTEVVDELTNDGSEIVFFNGSIIYHIIDAFEEWRAENKQKLRQISAWISSVSWQIIVSKRPHI